MAIVKNTFNIRTLPSAANNWYVSLQTEDASDCEAILAAEAGKSHYITRLLVRADVAMDILVGSGGDAGTAVTTVHFGPIPLAAASGSFMWKSPNDKMGLKCTSGLSIAIDSTASGTLWIYAEGVTCKD